MHHAIAKVTIKATANSGMDGIALQHTLSKLFWDELTEKMEQLFDRVSGEQEVLLIEQLTIDLGTISSVDWEASLQEKLLLALELALKKAMVFPRRNTTSQNSSLESSRDATTESAAAIQQHIRFDLQGEQQMPATKRLFDAWMYFLKTGALPTSTVVPNNETIWQQAILETLSVDQHAEAQFALLIRRQPAALTRLVLQFDESFLVRIASVLNRQKMAELPAWREIVRVFWMRISQLETSSTGFKNWVKTLQAAFETSSFWILYFNAVVQGSLKNLPSEQAILLAAADLFQSTKTENLRTLTKWLSKKQGNLENQLPEQTTLSTAADLFESTKTEKLRAPNKKLSKKRGGPKTGHAGSKDQEAPINPMPFQALPSVLAAQIKVLAENAAVSLHDPHTTAVHPKVDLKKLEQPEAASPALNLEPQYIQQAGIVLLHAFLPACFQTLGFLDEQKQFRDPASQQRAIHVLQYLSTGEERLPEYRLLLPKLLCGLPLDIPVARDIRLTESDKTEADQLLKAVIGHWAVLGNATPDGLREGFFDRSGKLTRSERGPRLQVTSRTQDILLNRLPWSIAFIKLPWMAELLEVEWSF